jgi:hypothetical protein
MEKKVEKPSGLPVISGVNIHNLKKNSGLSKMIKQWKKNSRKQRIRKGPFNVSPNGPFPERIKGGGWIGANYKLTFLSVVLSFLYMEDTINKVCHSVSRKKNPAFPHRLILKINLPCRDGYASYFGLMEALCDVLIQEGTSPNMNC